MQYAEVEVRTGYTRHIVSALYNDRAHAYLLIISYVLQQENISDEEDWLTWKHSLN